MGRHKAAMPSYRLHKPSGKAVVTIEGHDLYLGKFGTDSSRLEYTRIIAEYTATGQIPARMAPTVRRATVDDIVAAYWQHAEGYYVKNGQPTQELAAMRQVLRPVSELFGSEPADEFGPMKLKEIRKRWVKAGHTRKTINNNVGRITRAFRWAASEELIPASVPQALGTVSGLRKGRCNAKEQRRIEPVDLKTVEATMRHLCQVVKDMIRVQLLTGMRPGEVCALRPGDIDRSGDVWEFRYAEHKTDHHERERVIFIGPEAQRTLAPYLLRAADAYCFSPAEAVKQQREAKNAARTTPNGYGNRPGHRSSGLAGDNATRPAGDFYTNNSYRRAIHRACDAAFKPEKKLKGEALKKWQAAHRWSPNRLRHTKGTEVRKRFGLDAAQVILGHSFADVTQIYAERDAEKAREVARAIG